MDSFKLYLRQPRMVPCPDCGRMVSRKARACPGCGGPVHVGVVAAGVALKYGLIAAMLMPGWLDSSTRSGWRWVGSGM